MIQIIETETEEVVKILSARNDKEAEKIEDGINRQLNHDLYHTEVIDIK